MTDSPRQGGALAVFYIVASGIGLTAAFILLIEKIALLKDAAYVPSCSLNPVLSCGSIMKTWQAELLGFPNPVIGVVGFSVLLTIGVVLLCGAHLPRWFWLGLQVGTTLSVVFIHWLIYQSLYVIGALCPYCMAVWAVTIPVFWYTTLHNSGRTPKRPARIAQEYHGAFLTGWFLLLASLIGVRFWEYWSTLIP